MMSERNPHYVTPEEAEKMKCHMSFNAVTPDDEHYLCLGPKCMAWRWHEYQVPIPENERTGPNFWRKETNKTHGRCGMVPE